MEKARLPVIDASVKKDSLLVYLLKFFGILRLSLACLGTTLGCNFRFLQATLSITGQKFSN